MENIAKEVLQFWRGLSLNDKWKMVDRMNREAVDMREWGYEEDWTYGEYEELCSVVELWEQEQIANKKEG